MRRTAPTTMSVEPENQPYLSGCMVTINQLLLIDILPLKIALYGIYKKENLVILPLF